MLLQNQQKQEELNKHMKNNHAGFSTLTTILILFIAIVGVYLLVKNGGFPTNSQNTATSSELNSASSELDSTDVNSMDAELNQLDTDTSSF